MLSILKTSSPFSSALKSNIQWFSLWELLTSGGPMANVILLLIFFLFLAAIFIFFERLFALGYFSRGHQEFSVAIRDMIHEEKISAALDFCRESKVPAALMIEKGLVRIGRPLSEISKSMENLGKQQIYHMEKGVRALAMISRAAPMLGFLGTVIGMIMAFYNISQAHTQPNPQLLAQGIYTAMNTTAAGLIVGIVTYIFYNLLVIKIDRAAANLEATASDFIDAINQPLS